ncbi:MAG: YkgJ family cysteine cluster protein [Spirochaetales bacterium]|nr:YkgJ family cysteine cluster protein [Spirochaetales bacterium]
MESVKKWWDSICLECGQCCCEKYPYKRTKKETRRIPGSLSVNRRFFIDFTRPCSYLDIEEGRCMVYENRFTVFNICIPMTIFHALFADYLPPDCGYVKKFRFWLR